MEPPHSTKEQAVASAVAALASNAAGKRDRNVEAHARISKAARVGPSEDCVSYAGDAVPATVTPDADAVSKAGRVLRSHPYFYYQDFSALADPDPLVPLTSPGRVPNFPAKMHSILSRPDLVDVVAWMPHGRSWRVLKPREFEKNVIPKYFEHNKFSSFIRQANGWGFRRITQGRDRNSYYHEMFLRGLPHLCKMMKRPGVSEKQSTDPEHEPDLFKISEEKPVPERAEDASILLQCTLEGGPKARMPIGLGNLLSGNKSSSVPSPSSSAVQTTLHTISPRLNPTAAPTGTVHGASTYYTGGAALAPAVVHHGESCYVSSMPITEDQINSTNWNMPLYQQTNTAGNHEHVHDGQQRTPFVPQEHEYISVPTAAPHSSAPAVSVHTGTADCSQKQASTPRLTSTDDGTACPAPLANPLSVMPAAFQRNPAAAAQFAAGFAAAAAMSNQSFQQLLGQAFGSFPTANSGNSGNGSNAGAPVQPPPGPYVTAPQPMYHQQLHHHQPRYQVVQQSQQHQPQQHNPMLMQQNQQHDYRRQGSMADTQHHQQVAPHYMSPPQTLQ